MTTDTTTPKPRLASIAETQRQLGDVGRTYVYNLIGRGELEVVKLGSRSFVLLESIDAYIERLRVAE